MLVPGDDREAQPAHKKSALNSEMDEEQPATIFWRNETKK